MATTTPANVDALMRATLGRGAAAAFDVIAAGDDFTCADRVLELLPGLAGLLAPAR